MNNSSNTQGQKVRDGVNDPRQRNQEPQMSTIPSGPPLFYHHPPATSPPIDPYSHTANSTAGFAQKSAYPTLTPQNPVVHRQNFPERVESTPTNFSGHIVGQDRINAATNQSNNLAAHGRNARELLQQGAVIQLLSKSSRHLLQVVMTPNSILAFDGTGANNSFNTYFTVEEGEKGRFRFHNNCNYLAFDGKQPSILTLPPGPKNNPSIDFRVQDISGTNEFVAFESCACKNHFISISPDGYLKTTNLKEKNIDAQFSVVPITINQQPPYPYPAQPYQQFHMHPYAAFPPNTASGFVPPQPPMYHQQPQVLPPPVSSTQSPAPVSSGLYPQFN